MGPEDLGKVLRQLPPVVDPAVLVGFATSDDAAVYRLGDLALVSTVDIFTPIVDDPEAYGRIAAANALSDVYAMGARPLFALSIVGFPTKTLPLDTLAAILKGGAATCAEAGIAIVGGHSIDDAEPKYGLAVTGVVDPAKVVQNSTGKAGDVLVLTKAIGTGVISQAVKAGKAPREVEAAAIASMARLNRDACAAMLEVGVDAGTDVTGFGLLGHLHEMAHGSGLAARIDARAVPMLPGAVELAGAGVLSGGSKRNAAYFGKWIAADGIDATTMSLLCDAQTSGGLLMAVPRARVEALRAALRARGVLDAIVGELVEGTPGQIGVF